VQRNGSAGCSTHPAPGKADHPRTFLVSFPLQAAGPPGAVDKLEEIVIPNE
jgi:hypothetical protein